MRLTTTKFRIHIPDSDLADLLLRLKNTRWPENETSTGWSQGIPLEYMQEIASYWGTEYDWRAREKLLNRFPQFVASVFGLQIHFIHAPSPHANALPLILSHGWPGSIAEFHKVIEPLTDPGKHGGDNDDAFHVVVPSLPGFGFSGKPTHTGWSVERIADAWDVLMTGLGYPRYVAQGGDWGAMITAAMGSRKPDHVLCIHSNMPIVDLTACDFTDLSPQEQACLDDIQNYRTSGSGYSKQQSTRPQTLAYGLADSPIAQAAWILEKFHAWTDCSGHPENVLTKDELLDNVMLYWLPGCGASSARIYWESFDSTEMNEVLIPAGCSIFPKEIFRVSKRWAETRFKNLVYWNELDRGGHFAAFEQPELFVRELRACFRHAR